MDNPATELRRLERDEKNRKSALADKQEDLDLLHLMETVGGRRFLRRVLHECKHGMTATDPTSSRVYENLGKQAVARELVKWMQDVSTLNWLLLEKEGLEEVKSKKNLKGGQ